MKKIILASASPRRYELLRQIGVTFEVQPSDIDEKLDMELGPGAAVENLSFRKAASIAESAGCSCIVIGADTIVVKGAVYGKPQDEDHAFVMLKSLQDGWHDVITGVSVIDTSCSKSLNSHVTTHVKMRALSDDDIWSYIRTGEPMDKAGAYGIQGMGAILVERIEGCYFNVVGLPLSKLGSMLAELGVNVLR